MPAAVCAALLLVGVTGFFLLKARGGPDSSRQALAMSAGLVLAWASAGAGSATLRHRKFLDSPLRVSFLLLRLNSPPTMIVRGWVADDPVRRGGRVRFLFNVEEENRKGIWCPSNGVVRVSLRDLEGSFRAGYGDRFEMPVRLREARNFKNPGAFDYRLALEADGIHLLGTLKSWRLATRVLGSGGLKVLRAAHRLRMRLLRRLAKAFPGQEGEEPRRFLSAILLGERDGGEGKLDPLMRKTGVYHILSISGLHFALLMALLSRVTRRLPGRGWLGVPLLLLMGGLYLLLSGGDDPILRSALAA
ncbi:MAG: ComEC/Rec2 family competence protein, partial [Acidobacteria bacterium]|nr:ComEC/Rec2 family competence protein [Acidobacteriota bacterium]